MKERLLWDIPKIFAAEDVKAAHFKKILRVQKAVLISNTDTCQSLANEPEVRDGSFVLEKESFLDSTTWLTCSSMAKLMADFSQLGTKTCLGSLRHAGDFQRGSKA